MAKPRDDRQKDLFRPPLDRVIDLGHPLARLAGEIDRGFLGRRFSAGPGQPARLAAHWRRDAPHPRRQGLFAATTIPTSSGSGSAARFEESPPPPAAR